MPPPNSFNLDSWNAWTPSATGWASFTNQSGGYAVIGDIVLAYFVLRGTSNATSVVVTLPIAAANFADFAFRVQDNGTFKTASGLGEISGSSLTCYSDMAGNSWTASGTKQVSGAFFYRATS